MKKEKLSLYAAAALSFNVIVGSAFFLGVQGVTEKSGILSPISWVIWGIIVLPIVLVLVKFSNIYPEAGGIYVYSKKELGNFGGFITGWGYFIGSLAGNAVIIHEFGKGIKNIGFLNNFFQTLGMTNLYFDLILITFFTFLNLANINFLEKTHVTFSILKLIPLFFVIISSLFLFDINNITTAPLNFSGFFESIPLIIFAYMGFEVCCSITHQIENGKKNAGKAILLSIGIIMAFYFLLQLCLLGIHGTTSQKPFLDIFPKLTNNPFIIMWGNKIIYLSIMSCFLAGYYGMFYTNNWVLYAIGEEKELPFSKSLIKLNKYKIPINCTIIQSILIVIFLLITQNKYYLITMSVFAVIISYLLSSISFMYRFFKEKNIKSMILGILATISSLYLLYICIEDLLKAGLKYLIPFILILATGIILNKIGKLNNNTSHKASRFAKASQDTDGS